MRAPHWDREIPRLCTGRTGRSTRAASWLEAHARAWLGNSQGAGDASAIRHAAQAATIERRSEEPGHWAARAECRIACRCSYATKQQQQGDRVEPGLRKALFTPHPASRVERGHVPPALHVETSCRARRQSSYGPKRCSGELVLFRRHGGAGSWLPLDSAGSYYGLVWFPHHTIPEK